MFFVSRTGETAGQFRRLFGDRQRGNPVDAADFGVVLPAAVRAARWRGRRDLVVVSEATSSPNRTEEFMILLANPRVRPSSALARRRE
jgi:hypothetical protein